MKTALLLSIGIFFHTGIFAQGFVNRCATHEKMMELRALDPVSFDQHQTQQEQILQNWITNYSPQWKAQRAIIIVPVVVQIFGTTPNTAITDNRVYEQITVLNQDFRRTNTDTNKTPSVWKSISADIEIEFCLATVDQNGNSTTGIVRKTGSNSPSQSDLWNTSKYLNLLVYSIGGGTLGYTYLPSSAPNNGVHIGYQYFGKTGASAPFNKGRTATHEIGHWFNLEHIWGDANCGNDKVADTPKQQQENYNCPAFPKNPNSCSATNPDGDMFMNYMDYTNDNCMNMFTEGQKARMLAAINTYRPGLLTSGGCPGVLTADFFADTTTLFAGGSVNFFDNSSTNSTSWNWTFAGGTPASSPLQNPVNIFYNDTGMYEVKLIVSDGTGSDTLTKTAYINVITPPEPPTGIWMREGKSTITVFPNPNTGKFIIQSSFNGIVVNVLNVLGEVIYKSFISNGQFEIDLTASPKGIYFIKIETGEKTVIKKICVM